MVPIHCLQRSSRYLLCCALSILIVSWSVRTNGMIQSKVWKHSSSWLIFGDTNYIFYSSAISIDLRTPDSRQLPLFIDEYAPYLHIPALSHAILSAESMQVSQNWELYLISQLFRVAGQSSVNDLKVSAEVCMPLINTIVTEIKNGTYPQGSFLNVDVPTDAAHHKVNQQQWSEVK